jgi:MOSC domain-containing protein YiiM
MGEAPEALDQAFAVLDFGFDGDSHARPGQDRQVLLVSADVLATLSLAAGQLRENVTVAGLDVDALKSGDVVHLGDEVVIEIRRVCEPCHKMDEIRPGLQDALQGRRGTLGRVRRAGVVSVGDEVRVAVSEDA